jgi:hypothetical protein
MFTLNQLDRQWTSHTTTRTLGVLFIYPDFRSSLSGVEDSKHIGLVYGQGMRGGLALDQIEKKVRGIMERTHDWRVTSEKQRQREPKKTNPWSNPLFRHSQSNSSKPISRAGFTIATPAFLQQQRGINKSVVAIISKPFHHPYQPTATTPWNIPKSAKTSLKASPTLF